MWIIFSRKVHIIFPIMYSSQNLDSSLCNFHSKQISIKCHSRNGYNKCIWRKGVSSGKMHPIQRLFKRFDVLLNPLGSRQKVCRQREVNLQLKPVVKSFFNFHFREKELFKKSQNAIRCSDIASRMLSAHYDDFQFKKDEMLLRCYRVFHLKMSNCIIGYFTEMVNFYLANVQNDPKN